MSSNHAIAAQIIRLADRAARLLDDRRYGVPYDGEYHTDGTIPAGTNVWIEGVVVGKLTSTPEELLVALDAVCRSYNSAAYGVPSELHAKLAPEIEKLTKLPKKQPHEVLIAAGVITQAQWDAAVTLTGAIT